MYDWGIDYIQYLYESARSSAVGHFNIAAVSHFSGLAKRSLSKNVV